MSKVSLYKNEIEEGYGTKTKCAIGETSLAEDANSSLQGLSAFSEKLQEVWKNLARLDLIEKEILLLHYKFKNLYDKMPSIVPINTLSDELYEVVNPLHAKLEKIDDNYVVSVPEIDISASGETQAIAIEAFKEMVIASIEILESTPDDHLSNRLISNKNALKKLIKKRNRALANINKEMALIIAGKLHAVLEKKKQAHDVYKVIKNGKMVAIFGIRRGSSKDLGHDHMPSSLHISPHQTKALGLCPWKDEDYFNELRRTGHIS